MEVRIIKISGAASSLVSLACSFKLHLQTTSLIELLEAIASQDASMVASLWTHNTCYSLCIVVSDSFAYHVFIFDYAPQVVLCGK